MVVINRYLVLPDDDRRLLQAVCVAGPPLLFG